MKLSNLAEGPGSAVAVVVLRGSLRGFPRLLFGGGGFFLASEATPRLARCSLASTWSSSSEVRGLSSFGGGAASKIEVCEIEAVSALEPLSLTGIGPAEVFCCTTVSREDDEPRSPVNSILLKASTSIAGFDGPLTSLAPEADWALAGLLGALANRPNVSLTASSFEEFDPYGPTEVISLLTFAFSRACSMTLSSSPSEGSAAKGSLERAWL